MSIQRETGAESGTRAHAYQCRRWKAFWRCLFEQNETKMVNLISKNLRNRCRTHQYVASVSRVGVPYSQDFDLGRWQTRRPVQQAEWASFKRIHEEIGVKLTSWTTLKSGLAVVTPQKIQSDFVPSSLSLVGWLASAVDELRWAGEGGRDSNGSATACDELDAKLKQLLSHEASMSNKAIWSEPELSCEREEEGSKVRSLLHLDYFQEDD